VLVIKITAMQRQSGPGSTRKEPRYTLVYLYFTFAALLLLLAPEVVLLPQPSSPVSSPAQSASQSDYSAASVLKEKRRT